MDVLIAFGIIGIICFLVKLYDEKLENTKRLENTKKLENIENLNKDHELAISMHIEILMFEQKHIDAIKMNKIHNKIIYIGEIIEISGGLENIYYKTTENKVIKLYNIFGKYSKNNSIIQECEKIKLKTKIYKKTNCNNSTNIYIFK